MMIETDIPPERLGLLDTVVLLAGGHPTREGFCASELINFVVTGRHEDNIPSCLTATLNVLPALNDGPWSDDAHRTRVLRPYLHKMLGCLRDTKADFRRACELVDYAVRVAVPNALDKEELKDEAARLRALEPVTDVSTAYSAVTAAKIACNAAGGVYTAEAARRAYHATSVVYDVANTTNAADTVSYVTDWVACVAHDVALAVVAAACTNRVEETTLELYSQAILDIVTSTGETASLQ